MTTQARSTDSNSNTGTTSAQQHSLAPYLAVADARAALDWYTRVFAAKRRGEPYVMEDGRIGHAELVIGDSALMLADEYPELGLRGPKAHGGVSVSLTLQVPDVDATVELARRGRGARLPRLGRGLRSARRHHRSVRASLAHFRSSPVGRTATPSFAGSGAPPGRPRLCHPRGAGRRGSQDLLRRSAGVAICPGQCGPGLEHRGDNPGDGAVGGRTGCAGPVVLRSGRHRRRDRRGARAGRSGASAAGAVLRRAGGVHGRPGRRLSALATPAAVSHPPVCRRWDRTGVCTGHPDPMSALEGHGASSAALMPAPMSCAPVAVG